MRTGRPAPQAEQGQLAASGWQESRNSSRLPRFHDDQQVAHLEFEIRSISGICRISWHTRMSLLVVCAQMARTPSDRGRKRTDLVPRS
jgi:hypothetical protein